MVDQEDMLMREVREDLQRERLAKLWEQYGLYALAAAALLVAGVGGYKWLEQRNKVAAEAAGARYVEAVRGVASGKPDESRAALTGLAVDPNRGYATLARLRLAAADAKAGKSTEAIAAYEAIEADRSTDRVLADYARLQAAMLKLDTANWTEMQNRLNDLALESNAWRHSARELLGMAALRAGNTGEARVQFERLQGDRSTPPGIGERVLVMLAALTEAELAKAAPGAATPAGPSLPVPVLVPGQTKPK